MRGSFRRRLAALVVAVSLGAAATLVTASAASAVRPDDIVTKKYTDFGIGQKMESTGIFYRGSGSVHTGTHTWTEGWFGFHGCVNSEVFDRNGNWMMSSAVHRYGTTWEKRYDGFSWWVPKDRTQDVGSLVVNHWKC